MTRYTAYVAVTIVHYVWIVLCMGTCAYAVFWLNFSGWWFALAVICCSSDIEKRILKADEEPEDD